MVAIIDLAITIITHKVHVIIEVIMVIEMIGDKISIGDR